MKNGVGVNYACSHRNFSVLAPSVEGSSVLRAPGWAAEAGAAGVVGGWGDHAAVASLATHLGHNFTLGIGHGNASLLQNKREKV